MPTLQALLDDIDARLPNTFTQTQKVNWINLAQNEIWRFMASTSLFQFLTVGGQSVYAFSTNNDMHIDMIKYVAVSDSTVIDGTENYQTYQFAGLNDALTGSQYFDNLGSTGGLGLYPTPSTVDGSGHNVKVLYETSPVQLSTTTLTTVPSINPEFHDVLKFRTMKIIAQSGNNPDVELANNYQLEEDAIMKKIQMNYHIRKFRKPKDTYRRSEAWWNG